jgi:hypothetical protein
MLNYALGSTSLMRMSNGCTTIAVAQTRISVTVPAHAQVGCLLKFALFQSWHISVLRNNSSLRKHPTRVVSYVEYLCFNLVFAPLPQHGARCPRARKRSSCGSLHRILLHYFPPSLNEISLSILSERPSIRAFCEVPATGRSFKYLQY